jgi:ribosomal protein S18 acetylase RimI-like enzyme
MPDVTIRSARPDDADAIAAIHVASWQHAYRGILPDDYLDTLVPAQRLPMWNRVLSPGGTRGSVSVAEIDGQVTGFAFIGPSDEGDPDDVLMLYAIYLDPGVMGRGIGTALMIDAERQMVARDAILGVLRVITANERTLAFYERCGWTPDPSSLRMEDAWGQQVETIRYRKRLG